MGCAKKTRTHKVVLKKIIFLGLQQIKSLLKKRFVGLDKRRLQSNIISYFFLTLKHSVTTTSTYETRLIESAEDADSIRELQNSFLLKNPDEMSGREDIGFLFWNLQHLTNEELFDALDKESTYIAINNGKMVGYLASMKISEAKKNAPRDTIDVIIKRCPPGGNPEDLRIGQIAVQTAHTKHEVATLLYRHLVLDIHNNTTPGHIRAIEIPTENNPSKKFHRNRVGLLLPDKNIIEGHGIAAHLEYVDLGNKEIREKILKTIASVRGISSSSS